MQLTSDTPGSDVEEVSVNVVQPDGTVFNDLTAGQYDVVISSVPTRESYMDTQFEEAARLKEMGVQIPDAHLINNSHLAKKNEIIEDMSNDAAAQQQAQMAELEMASLQADVQNKQVDAQRKAAETQLAGARAEKTAVDAQKITVDTQKEMFTPPENNAAELEKIRLEAQLKREEMLMTIQLKREEMEANLQLKRDQMRQERAIKLAEAEERVNRAAWQQQPTRTQ